MEFAGLFAGLCLYAAGWFLTIQGANLITLTLRLRARWRLLLDRIANRPVVGAWVDIARAKLRGGNSAERQLAVSELRGQGDERLPEHVCEAIRGDDSDEFLRQLARTLDLLSRGREGAIHPGAGEDLLRNVREYAAYRDRLVWRGFLANGLAVIGVSAMAYVIERYVRGAGE